MGVPLTPARAAAAPEPRPDGRACSARAREAARQSALLAGIWCPPGTDDAHAPQRWRGSPQAQARGLRAYRDNATAVVTRALRVAYPTVDALVGDEAFAVLARAYARQHPPVCADLARYGEEFARAWAGSPGLDTLPYLADVARLDWAVHVIEAAADPAAQVIDLERLAQDDPLRLGLRFADGVACIESDWPVVSIWQAHHTERASWPAPRRFAAVNEALTAGAGECALVWRDGWRAGVSTLPAADAAFTTALLGGLNLAAALDRAGAAFAFDAWLLQAVQRQCLQAVLRLRDPEDPIAPPGASTS